MSITTRSGNTSSEKIRYKSKEFVDAKWWVFATINTLAISTIEQAAETVTFEAS